MDKTSVSIDELEDVVIDGAEDTSDDFSSEDTDTGVDDDADDEGNDIVDISINETEEVSIDGAESNDGDENNASDEGSDNTNTEIEDNNGDVEDVEFADSDASNNWSGNTEVDTVESTYGTVEQNDLESQSFTPEMEKGSMNDVKQSDSSTTTDAENNTTDNNNTDAEIETTWGSNRNNEHSDDRQDSTGRNGDVDGGKNRSERIFGRDESELDDAEPNDRESENDERENGDSQHGEISGRKRETTEHEGNTDGIGINEPSETIQVGETRPPDSIGQQSLTGPIDVVRSSIVGTIKRVTVIAGAIVGVLLWMGKVTGLVFEIVGTVMMVGYMAVVGMTLISPGITTGFIGVSTGTGRIGTIVAASIEYLPVVFALFFLAALIDEIANEGNRFKKRDRFSRL
jgi:hypothetical protein